MTKVIEFYIPDSLPKKTKYIARNKRGKLIEFPSAKGNPPDSDSARWHDMGCWIKSCSQSATAMPATNRGYKQHLIIAALLISTACPGWTQDVGRLPTTQDVVSHMGRVDRQRYLGFSGYSALRSYKLVSGSRWAEMFVRALCAPDGGKRFSILREEGSPIIRKHILHKIIEEETTASYLGTRIIPQNYFFNMIGSETDGGRPSYVLEVTPKTDNKDLFQGRIWVDAADYAITRIEGSPAHNPSFWIKTVHFVRTYEKVRDLWLPYSTVSTIEVRIFGTAELWVENTDYSLPPPADVSRGQDRDAQLTP